MIVDQKLVIAKLASIGIDVTGIYDLVNRKNNYTVAIPTLVDLLKYEFEDYKIKEGVVRAISVKEAKGIANPILIKEYLSVDKELMLYKWAIGNAMSLIATPGDYENIINIVSDKSNGISRQMFVIALGKFKQPKTEETLISLLHDDDVALHAITALKKVGTVNSIRHLEGYTTAKKTVIRNAANAAIKSILTRCSA